MAVSTRSGLERRFDALLARAGTYAGPAADELAKLLEVWVAELAHTRPMLWNDETLRARSVMLEQILDKAAA